MKQLRCQATPARTLALAPRFVSTRAFRIRCQARPSAGEENPASGGGNSISRRALAGAAAVTSALLALPLLSAQAGESRIGEVRHSEEEWAQILSKDAYRVLRQAATERPRTSPLEYEKRKGTFVCAGCGSPLFSSETKFNSGTGWPSFYDALPGAVDETADFSIVFMPRTEVRCHRCQGHLGHVFDDGPAPTGLRYCMNGVAMAFQAA